MDKPVTTIKMTKTDKPVTIAKTDKPVTIAKIVKNNDETKGNKKVPVPEGFVSPVGFAKVLSDERGEKVLPQTIYGYIRNMKGFPLVEREGTPRFVIPLKEATGFLKKKAEEASKKAEVG